MSNIYTHNSYFKRLKNIQSTCHVGIKILKNKYIVLKLIEIKINRNKLHELRHKTKIHQQVSF